MTHQNTPGYLSLYVGPGQPADLSSGADLSDADLDTGSGHGPGRPGTRYMAANEGEPAAEDDRPLGADWAAQAAQSIQEMPAWGIGGTGTGPSMNALHLAIWGAYESSHPGLHLNTSDRWAHCAARWIQLSGGEGTSLTADDLRSGIRDHYLRTFPGDQGTPPGVEIEDDEPKPEPADWALQVAERVWDYLLGQHTVPPTRDIRATLRSYLTLVTGVGHPFDYSSDHWTTPAAKEIQVMELRQGSTVDRIQQTLMDYKRIADGEVDDMPDPDAEVDDWAARAATELMYMIRQRVGDLSAEGIRLLIMDEYEDMNDDAADFDITAPIEHMDLESGAGTTVNIHAPVDVASFIMGPGSTINVFEPITEVAVEQENGGTVWFMATPNTSHVQQGPGGLHILATRPEGCAGCMGSDDCEGCDGIAEEDPC